MVVWIFILKIDSLFVPIILWEYLRELHKLKYALNTFLNDEKIETYIFSRYEKFDITLDKISQELSDYIFKTKFNFFIIINKFKYWQMSSDGNRWLIAKDSLKKLINLEEVEKFINDLKVDDLKDTEQELLEIWNRETRW